MPQPEDEAELCKDKAEGGEGVAVEAAVEEDEVRVLEDGDQVQKRKQEDERNVDVEAPKKQGHRVESGQKRRQKEKRRNRLRNEE